METIKFNVGNKYTMERSWTFPDNTNIEDVINFVNYVLLVLQWELFDNCGDNPTREEIENQIEDLNLELARAVERLGTKESD